MRETAALVMYQLLTAMSIQFSIGPPFQQNEQCVRALKTYPNGDDVRLSKRSKC